MPAQVSVPALRPFGPCCTLIMYPSPHLRLCPGKKSTSVERAGVVVLRRPASMSDGNDRWAGLAVVIPPNASPTQMAILAMEYFPTAPYGSCPLTIRAGLLANFDTGDRQKAPEIAP